MLAYEINSSPGGKPASLIIGSDTQTQEHVIKLLQQQLNPCKGCRNCNACSDIQRKSHESILWLTPQKNLYTLKDLDAIFEISSFKRSSSNPFFFIIQAADHLSVLCANRLLKIIEEPHEGYSFILLAQTSATIIDTLKSRCVIVALKNVHTPQEIEWHAFLTSRLVVANPLEFLACIETATNLEDVSHLDSLLEYWLNYRNQENNATRIVPKKIAAILEVLKAAYEHPISNGSGKLFWKNMFIKLRSLTIA